MGCAADGEAANVPEREELQDGAVQLWRAEHVAIDALTEVVAAAAAAAAS